MIDRVTWTLTNAQQGHVALEAVWRYAKPLLLAGHRLTLELRAAKRTTRQNSRYWSKGVLAQVAEQAVVGGRKFDAISWHELFKRKFLGVSELPDGQVVGKTSTTLTRKEFSEFCDQVEAYAVMELGVTFYELKDEQ